MNEKEQFPSIKEQGKNLAQFAFNVLHNPLLVSEEKKEERLNVCKKCEYYSMRQNRCKQCGCYLTHKVKFEVSACPVGKW